MTFRDEELLILNRRYVVEEILFVLHPSLSITTFVKNY